MGKWESLIVMGLTREEFEREVNRYCEHLDDDGCRLPPAQECAHPEWDDCNRLADAPPPAPERTCKITHVAMKCGENVYSLPSPKRHSDVLHLVYSQGETFRGTEGQGFLDSDGRFLDRIEAMKVAVAAGQVGVHTERDYLLSEDLW